MEENNQQKKKMNTKFIVVLVALVLIGGGYGVYKYLHGKAHEITDDAQIEAKITPVIPKVSGYIKKILVEDNQMVKKGDTLDTISRLFGVSKEAIMKENKLIFPNITVGDTLIIPVH